MSNTKWSEAFVLMLVVLYNFCLVAGTTYLVAEREWSMWTYLLTLCFMTTVKTGKAAEKNE